MAKRLIRTDTNVVLSVASLFYKPACECFVIKPYNLICSSLKTGIGQGSQELLCFDDHAEVVGSAFVHQ